MLDGGAVSDTHSGNENAHGARDPVGLTTFAEAASVERGSNGLLCFPFVEGASVPHQDDTVRAVFHGISGHHRRAHFVRAVLEGIAYQYPSLLDVVTTRGLEPTSMTISDGEARSELWNQIKADVLGAPLIPPFVSRPPPSELRSWPASVQSCFPQCPSPSERSSSRSASVRT
jgi:sugar (pentulose or hexulose) kinase